VAFGQVGGWLELDDMCVNLNGCGCFEVSWIVLRAGFK
jgi:hypothetical protein